MDTEIDISGAYGSSIWIKYLGKEIYFGYGVGYESDLSQMSKATFLDLMSKLYDMAEVK